MAGERYQIHGTDRGRLEGWLPRTSSTTCLLQRCVQDMKLKRLGLVEPQLTRRATRRMIARVNATTPAVQVAAIVNEMGIHQLL